MAYAGAGQQQRVAAGSNTYQYTLTGIASYSPGQGNRGPATVVWRPNINATADPISYRVSGTTYWYLVNPTDGSIVGVFDASGQVFTDEILYTPDGQVVNPSQLDPYDPLGYEGFDTGDGSGFDDTGSGYYDASTGLMVDNTDDSFGDASSNGHLHCGYGRHLNSDFVAQFNGDTGYWYTQRFGIFSVACNRSGRDVRAYIYVQILTAQLTWRTVPGGVKICKLGKDVWLGAGETIDCEAERSLQLNPGIYRLKWVVWLRTSKGYERYEHNVDRFVLSPEGVAYPYP
jgi:hypothetical protein